MLFCGRFVRGLRKGLLAVFLAFGRLLMGRKVLESGIFFREKA